jgi:hypothetical protein
MSHIIKIVLKVKRGLKVRKNENRETKILVFKIGDQNFIKLKIRGPKLNLNFYFLKKLDFFFSFDGKKKSLILFPIL